MKKLLILIVFMIFAVLLIHFSPQIFVGFFNNYDTALLPNPTELKYNQQLSGLANNILSAQQVTSIHDLDCEEIPDSQFITIGNKFLDMMFENGPMRKQLSETTDVTQAEIQLGKYYMTCPNTWTATFPSPQTQQIYGEELNKQILSVLQNQNVNSVKELDCKKITDTQFVRVGNANMDMMIGDDNVHAQIDKLVSEKGLQYIRNADMQSGKIALGC